MNVSLPTRIPQNDDSQAILLARLRGNPNRGTLLASAARTASTSTTTMELYGFNSVLVFLNITASSGTGGLVIFPEYLDPVSGAWNRLWNYPATASRITSTGLQVVAIGVGIGTQSGGVNQSGLSATPISSQMRFTINHGDASSYTYSLGYEAL